MNPRRRPRTVLAALVLAPVLVSCGFNQPTDRVYNPGVGVNERSGSVDVLNALIVSGASGSGTLVATLSNNDTEQPDTLGQVTGAQDQGLTFSLDAPVEVPSGGAVSLSDETEISVEGEAIEPGAFVRVSFSFERGENVSVEVPVVARRGPYAEIPVPSVAPTTAAPSEPADH